MSEIRNLTRNGETFYPLTTSSAVINESTGEGLIIDDVPTEGSDNLVKSGGIARAIPVSKDVNVYDIQGVSGVGTTSIVYIDTPVKAETTYICHPTGSGNYRQFAKIFTFVYENGQKVEKEVFVSYITSQHRSTADWDDPIVAQYDADGFGYASYPNLPINVYHTAKEAVVSGVNTRMSGKKWQLIGDSISTEHGAYANNGYGYLVSKSLGMEYTKVAVSGVVMSYFYNLIDDYSNDFDLITVMLGANNHGYNTSIGELNDQYYQNGEYNTNDSFYAQTQLLFEKLHAKYPRAVIMFATTIKRGDAATGGYAINTLGLTTKAYADAIKNVCDWYSIPCIDIFNSIDPRTQANRVLYFMSANDVTHPNDLGHALYIAPIFEAEMLKHAKFFIQQ